LKSAYWEAVPIFDRVLQAFDIPHAQKEKRGKKKGEKTKHVNCHAQFRV
jgi:hypothetical protein